MQVLKENLENKITWINQKRGDEIFYYKLGSRNGFYYVDKLRISNDLPDSDAIFSGTKTEVLHFLAGMMEILK